MKQTTPLRGVNLGGWLVLEKWMTPSLFEGTSADDEFGLARTAGFSKKLAKHRKSFITEADFLWLKSHGINAVRVPIGFWVLKSDQPLKSARQQLDWLFDMANKHEIRVLICLHGAFGSQNGKDHSGRQGKVGWYQTGRMWQTRHLLLEFAGRYQPHPSFWGLELLNEPMPELRAQKLRLAWWTKWLSIELGRRHPDLAIVYSDAFSPDDWNRKTAAILDVHHYQCFSESDRKLAIAEHIKKAQLMKAKIRHWRKKQPVIIGEWSLGLDQRSLQGTNRRVAEKKFARAQLASFSEADGWFFWNYRTEKKDGWNFRHLVESGVITPEDLL